LVRDPCDGIECGLVLGLNGRERRRMTDALRFRSFSVGALRRFASLRQTLLAGRTRGSDSAIGFLLSRSNEILESLLNGKELLQSLVIAPIDPFHHNSSFARSRVVRDLNGRLTYSQLFEPRHPLDHSFAGGGRHAQVVWSGHDPRERIDDRVDTHVKQIREQIGLRVGCSANFFAPRCDNFRGLAH
jgi:hypothetical protein